jgi:hypothetical protein
MKRVTKKWLISQSACAEGMRFVTKEGLVGLGVTNFVKRLMEKKKYNWANWLIARCMTHTQYTNYAIYAAEQVVHIYNMAYPEDKRVQQAVDAAKRYINDGASWAAAGAAAGTAAEAAWAAAGAAEAAWAAAGAAGAEMQIKILTYGINLLKLGYS